MPIPVLRYASLLRTKNVVNVFVARYGGIFYGVDIDYFAIFQYIYVAVGISNDQLFACAHSNSADAGFAEPADFTASFDTVF